MRRRGVIASALRPLSAGDPFFSSVALLLHMDGANTSTTFVDSGTTPKTVTAVSGAQVSTAQSKFGGASLLLNGAAANLSIPDSVDFAFGSGDFTLECWIYPTSLGTNLVFSKWKNGVATECTFIFYLSSGHVQLSYGVGSLNTGAASTGTVAANVWSHIAAVRSGTTVRYFINGVLDATTLALTGSLNVNTNPLRVGVVDDGTSFPFAGYIDEVRITKGVARYSANFTPPTAAFPNS